MDDKLLTAAEAIKILDRQYKEHLKRMEAAREAEYRSSPFYRGDQIELALEAIMSVCQLCIDSPTPSLHAVSLAREIQQIGQKALDI
jgi:SRSO17 transposase